MYLSTFGCKWRPDARERPRRVPTGRPLKGVMDRLAVLRFASFTVVALDP
jgi:hypothetical protein